MIHILHYLILCSFIQHKLVTPKPEPRLATKGEATPATTTRRRRHGTWWL